jgi:hypothetical protein
MSDSLPASIEKLKLSTSRLNKITDEAAKVVQEVEAFLNKECSVGIETYVLVHSEPMNDHGLEEYTHLGYARWQGKYRIVVSVGCDHDQDETKPWSDWNRAIKLETVKKLPELIERIANEVDAHVRAAQETTTAVTSILRAIDRKEGK